MLLWSLVSISFIGLTGVLRNLYLLRLNFDTREIGLLVGTGQLTWAIAALPAAVVSRRLGPKRAIMIALAVMGVTFACFMLVELIPVKMQMPWLMLWNTINGIGIALLLVSSSPYLAGVTQAAERSYAFAIQSAVVPFAAFFGSVFAGQLPGWVAQATGSELDQPVPYRFGLWLVPVMYAATSLIFWRADSVTLVKQHDASQAAARAPFKTLIIFGAIATLQATGEGAFGAFFSVYLDQRFSVPTAHIGALAGFGQLLPVLVALSTAPLMRRFGSGATFGLGALGSGIVLMAIALGTTAAFAAFGRIIAGITGQISGASRSLFSQDIVEARWRTLAAAVVTIGIGVGTSTVALAGGLLIQSIGYTGVFFLAGVTTLVSGVMAILFWRKHMAAMLPEPAPVLAESLSLE